jgi:beta-glucosidase
LTRPDAADAGGLMFSRRDFILVRIMTAEGKKGGPAAAYADSSLPAERRAEDLLSRMTPAEKIGQLMQLDGSKGYLAQIEAYGPGSLFHINGSDANEAIDAALRTRLGIPVLLADDGIHGHSFWAGATIFPTQLALACSWDPSLLEAVARATAREMRATGLAWTFSPVLCLARDLRWGRVGETFGEDPHLDGELAAAMVRGYQGRGLGDPDAVLATAKHYAGYSETLGGRDASEADLSRRKLRSYFLPPFERAAKAGCMAFMTGYQSMDGVPSTMNGWLLKEVLRDEWGFEGILVTDYDNVGRLVDDQRVCADLAEASAVALNSGNDMIMQTPGFFEGCAEALRRGLLSGAVLDESVRRVLTLKFRMGLFEDPRRGDPARVGAVVACEEHSALNLRAARESLVLLRNEPVDGSPLLPLDPSRPRRIALVGRNADDPIAQLGDWSLGSGQFVGPSGGEHPRSSVVTIRDGLRALLPAGWSLSDASVGADAGDGAGAEDSDLVALVLGDTVAYAGETKSTATLELQDGQAELAERVLALGKPTIVVLVCTKPLVLPRCVLEADAIIEAFNPGMQGGRAVAEAIFGLLNPSGRLSISIPVHVGQQPVHYNQVRGQHGTRYADLTQDPAFSFGFGLGYSPFEYGKPRLERDRLGRGEVLRASVELRNAGSLAGTETVQLYVEDEVTSATWARRELVAFRRVELGPGESARVELEAPVSELWIIDAEGRKVVESGAFKALVGSSSRDCDLRALSFVVE